MKKQKTKMLVIFSLGMLLNGIFSQNALAAAAGSTVSWIAPTTDEGNITPMTGLTGYRVYYSTSTIDCTDWNAATVDAREADTGTLLPSTYKNVSGGTKLRYSFSTSSPSVLNTNTTYYFAVVAYDADTNLSKCATAPDGITTTVSKLATFPSDISNGACTTGTHCVNGADYSLLHAAYSVSVAKPGNVADINGDDYVNGGDYSFLHAEYNQYF